jgi:hypothetical protein
MSVTVCTRFRMRSSRTRLWYERAHALSDVVTAVLHSGLTPELFHEQSYTNAPWPWAERCDDGYYRLPAGWPRSQLTYSLRARMSNGHGDRGDSAWSAELCRVVE